MHIIIHTFTVLVTGPTARNAHKNVTFMNFITNPPRFIKEKVLLKECTIKDINIMIELYKGDTKYDISMYLYNHKIYIYIYERKYKTEDTQTTKI